MIHDALDIIVQGLTKHGCISAVEPSAVSVLRDLGGYSRVVTSVLERHLAKLYANPRLTETAIERLQDQLTQRIPEARETVQLYLQRLDLLPRPNTSSNVAASRTDGHQRHPLTVGTHPEVTLKAKHLRIHGRLDLLTVGESGVDITDFKTGAESEIHWEQLRFYAALWAEDQESNPASKPVRRLTLSYPNRDLTIDGPQTGELHDLVEHVRIRVAQADAEVSIDDPKARLGEACGSCSVRVLCADFWNSRPDPATVVAGEWFDFEGHVVGSHGVKSWWLDDVKMKSRRILIRVASVGMPIRPGQRLKFLGLRRESDPEIDGVVAVMTATSEMFEVVATPSAHPPD